MVYLYLDIVGRFLCRQCGACCRHDWLVTVDEAGFRRNRELFRAMDREAEFRQAFVPLGPGGAYGEYAKVAKKSNGGCWFLTTQNLCSLQQLAGLDHLDDVCRWFPRYPMDTERGLEYSLSFSCPAALQLAMRREPLQVVRGSDPPLPVPQDGFAVRVYPGRHLETSALRHYFEIEANLVELLQQRQLPLPVRIGMVRDMLVQLAGLCQPGTMREDIRRLFREAFFRIGAEADGSRAECDRPVSWLIENYFVNFFFCKSLFRLGFERAVERLDRMRDSLQDFLRETAVPGETDSAAAIIVRMELEYNHNSGGRGPER